MRRRIVVFGATGSVGAYFVDYCHRRLAAKGFDVIAVGRMDAKSFFDRIGIPYCRVDIANEQDFAQLPAESVHAVVNCAGIMPAYVESVDYRSYVNVNVLGAVNVLEYARTCGADRVLYTQTWSDLAGYWGVEEVLHPYMPRKLVYTGDHAFYSATKSMAVDAMEIFWQEHGLKRFVFRLPNVYLYSPKSTYYVDGVKRVVAYRYMIERAILGDDIELWGDSQAFKDVLYIKDLCQLMARALIADIDGGIYNAGTGVKTTLQQQLEGIIEVFSPKPNRSKIVPRPDKRSFASFVMDIDNARYDLGYEPEYYYLDYLKDYKIEREAKRFDELWSR